MVDFDDKKTSAMPAIDLVRIIVLEAQYNFWYRMAEFKQVDDLGIDAEKQLVAANAAYYVLFCLRQAELKRRLSKEEYSTTEYAAFKEGGATFRELNLAGRILEKHFDEIKLTKLDVKFAHTSNIEESNKLHGYS